MSAFTEKPLSGKSENSIVTRQCTILMTRFIRKIREPTYGQKPHQESYPHCRSAVEYRTDTVFTSKAHTMPQCLQRQVDLDCAGWLTRVSPDHHHQLLKDIRGHHCGSHTVLIRSDVARRKLEATTSVSTRRSSRAVRICFRILAVRMDPTSSTHRIYHERPAASMGQGQVQHIQRYI